MSGDRWIAAADTVPGDVLLVQDPDDGTRPHSGTRRSAWTVVAVRRLAADGLAPGATALLLGPGGRASDQRWVHGLRLPNTGRRG